MGKNQALWIWHSIAIISHSYGPDPPPCEKIVLFHIWHTDILLCWSFWVRAEFFSSSVWICMFHRLQLRILFSERQTERPSPNLITFLSSLNYWKTSSYLGFLMRHLLLLQFVFKHFLGVVFMEYLKMCASCISHYVNASVSVFLVGLFHVSVLCYPGVVKSDVLNL